MATSSSPPLKFKLISLGRREYRCEVTLANRSAPYNLTLLINILFNQKTSPMVHALFTNGVSRSRLQIKMWQAPFPGSSRGTQPPKFRKKNEITPLHGHARRTQGVFAVSKHRQNILANPSPPRADEKRRTPRLRCIAPLVIAPSASAGFESRARRRSGMRELGNDFRGRTFISSGLSAADERPRDFVTTCTHV